MLRGQVTAACAAALFTVVAFSRPHGVASSGAFAHEEASHVASASRSVAHEPLACTLVSLASLGATEDAPLCTSGATLVAQSLSVTASPSEPLACGGDRAGESPRAICEESATLASQRQ